MFGLAFVLYQLYQAVPRSLVPHTRPPTYAELAADAQRPRPAEGRPFRFTLGGGEDVPELNHTLDKIPMADRDWISCGVAEWEYSFHHLRNGQEDGAGQKHYGGYPTPPKSRAEAMDVVRRYYLRLRDDAITKATPAQRRCFVSINGHYCYQHYACEWGCDVVGSEVGENINSIQTHIAMTRGAARQYGKPWLIDFSSWYGPSIFDEDPRRTWGDNSGPNNGHSLSLHVRSYYVSYMAGANVIVAEGGWLNGFRNRQPGPDGMLPLSSLGKEMARFYRFTRRHPDRGIPYAPIALVLPFDHGIYPGFGPKLTWHAFPYTPGDQRILDALNLFFPGSLGDPDQPERPDRQPDDPAWTDPDYMHTELLRLVASPDGDITDVLLANAQLQTLRSYPALILAGDFAPDKRFAERLSDYVALGGTLVLDSEQVSHVPLPTSLASRLSSPPPSGGYARLRYGRGTIVVAASAPSGQPTSARPLAHVVSMIRQEEIPFTVSGHVETLFNRTKDGWIVTLVNNTGVTKRFREPPVVNPKAAQTVTVTYSGRERLLHAALWGADSDEPMPSGRIQVSVPPGDVRILKVRLSSGRSHSIDTNQIRSAFDANPK